MQAIIFDLDQTLLDREGSLLRFLAWQCDGMLGPYLDDKAAFISRFVALDDNGKVWKDEVYRALLEEFPLGDWLGDELLSVYELCFCAFAIPKPGVLDAVKELAESYKLGLISNGKTPFQERNFRGLGIASYFESVIVSAAVDLRKPDPAIFHLGCGELGVLPEEAVYVGDNPEADIRGARDAGLKTVFVPSSKYPECLLADATCSDMNLLVATIQQVEAAVESG